MTRQKHEIDDATQQRLDALFEGAGKRLVDDALWAYYHAARHQKLEAFEGGRNAPGLRRKSPDHGALDGIETDARKEAAQAIEKIQPVLEANLTYAFGRIVVGILKDPILRAMWVSDHAKLVGKRGGRRRGHVLPHLAWLRERLEVMDNADPQPSAEQLFRRLQRDQDVEDVDDNKISLKIEVLGEYGYVSTPGKEEPFISRASVSRVLTQIRSARNR